MTESLGQTRRRLRAGRHSRAWARALLEVMMAAVVVVSRLALNRSDWMTTTECRLVKLRPLVLMYEPEQLIDAADVCLATLVSGHL
jgi:hypothetical protein